MSAGARELPVDVVLAEPLMPAAELDVARLRESIGSELEQLASELGIAVHPVVAVEAGESPPANGVVSLRVGGAPCRFSPTVLGDTLSYVDGTPVVLGPGEVRDRLLAGADDGGRRRAELLSLVARTAVSAQPGLLLPPGERADVRAAVDVAISVAGHDPAAGDPWDEQALADLAATRIDIEIDPQWLRALSEENPSGELFRFAREGLVTELGVPLPSFHFRPDPSLRERGFAFRFNALRTLPRIGLPSPTILVNDVPERLALIGVDSEPTVNPGAHQPGALVAREHKERLGEAGLTTWDPGGHLVLSLAAAVRSHAHTLMTAAVAGRMVDALRPYFPALARAADEHVPPDELASVLRELLRERVPIRNLRRILELLLRRETGRDEPPSLDRVMFVRSGLADAIAFGAARSTETVVAYIFDPKLEDEVVAATDGADESLLDRVSDAVRSELGELPPTAQRPVLLTRDEARRPLARMLRPEFDELRVLSYGDLPPYQNVQPIARLGAA